MTLAPLLDADKIQQLERFGEEGWSLVQVIQDSFNVEFSADDLIAANTVGRLGECISTKLKGSPRTERCLSAFVFYRLRRALMRLLAVQRSQIHSCTKLDQLFPWAKRQNQWRTLARQSDLSLPKLVYPSWLIAGLLLTSMAIAVVFGGSFWRMSNSGLATFGVWIFSFVVLGWLAGPLARAFPHSCDTVGGLVRVAVARNHSKLASELGPCSVGELFTVLRQLIAVEIGCELRDISESTAFPQGLRID